MCLWLLCSWTLGCIVADILEFMSGLLDMQQFLTVPTLELGMWVGLLVLCWLLTLPVKKLAFMEYSFGGVLGERRLLPPYALFLPIPFLKGFNEKRYGGQIWKMIFFRLDQKPDILL